MSTDTKAVNEICLISREGVCLLDMQQVMDKARELGLTHLAEIVERDLEEKRIVDGDYYTLIAPMFGEA